MRTGPLTDEHVAKLTEYGLSGIPLNACLCLRFEPGEMILQEGLPINWLAVVMRGKAKVCSNTPNGKHLILCYYLSQGLVGELEMMTDRKVATATMVAVTEFECVAIPYEDHETHLKSNPVFLNRMSTELAMKLIRSSESNVSASLHTAEERLCAYILQAAHNGVFNDVLTDVSCSVGMSYRHLHRLLRELYDDGVLEKRESGYRIVDGDELARRACHS